MSATTPRSIDALAFGPRPEAQGPSGFRARAKPRHRWARPPAGRRGPCEHGGPDAEGPVRRHRPWPALGTPTPPSPRRNVEELIDAGGVMREPLIHYDTADVVDDRELMSRAAPVDCCEHGHRILLRRLCHDPDACSTWSLVTSLEARFPMATCRARHRREGQVCRRTSRCAASYGSRPARCGRRRSARSPPPRSAPATRTRRPCGSRRCRRRRGSPSGRGGDRLQRHRR